MKPLFVKRHGFPPFTSLTPQAEILPSSPPPIKPRYWERVVPMPRLTRRPETCKIRGLSGACLRGTVETTPMQSIA